MRNVCGERLTCCCGCVDGTWAHDALIPLYDPCCPHAGKRLPRFFLTFFLSCGLSECGTFHSHCGANGKQRKKRDLGGETNGGKKHKRSRGRFRATERLNHARGIGRGWRAGPGCTLNREMKTTRGVSWRHRREICLLLIVFGLHILFNRILWQFESA